MMLTSKLRRLSAILILALVPPLAPAKRQKPSAELVPKPTQAELQVGSLRLHRCKDVPAYCGSIRRALDPSDGAMGTINIGFQFYQHLDTASAALGTIVATEGGPGYATTGTRRSYIALFRPLMDHHDLLLVDNRGTGNSDAVHCPLLQSEPNVQHEGI